MTERDLLDQLLNTDPKGPALSGAVLLLRAETKSEFATLRTQIDQRFEQVDQRFERVENRLDRVENRLEKMDHLLETIAQQVATLVARK